MNNFKIEYDRNIINIYLDDEETLFGVLVNGVYDEELQDSINRGIVGDELMVALEDIDEDNAMYVKFESVLQFYFDNN